MTCQLLFSQAQTQAGHIRHGDTPLECHTCVQLQAFGCVPCKSRCTDCWGCGNKRKHNIVTTTKNQGPTPQSTPVHAAGDPPPPHAPKGPTATTSAQTTSISKHRACNWERGVYARGAQRRRPTSGQPTNETLHDWPTGNGQQPPTPCAQRSAAGLCTSKCIGHKGGYQAAGVHSGQPQQWWPRTRRPDPCWCG